MENKLLRDVPKKQPIKVGDTVTIQGEIQFFMDFSFCRGSFSPNEVFLVKRIFNDGKTADLIAPGYGEKGNYGSGSIYVKEKYYSQLKPCKTNRYGILKRRFK